jgi:hypothetical protein
MGTRICQGGDIRSAEGPTEGGGWREEGLQQHGCKHTQPDRYVHTCRSSTGNQMTQQQLHLRPPLASLHIAGSSSFLYMHPSPQTHTCALPPPSPGRPCTAYVPTSCLDSKSMDACTKDLTDTLLSSASSASNQPRTSLSPAALAAAIAVPVAAAVAAGVVFGVWLCRRRGRAANSPKTFAVRKREMPADDVFDDATDVETGSRGPTTDPDDSGG